ncbi:MAG TPA: kelch repeat-containing protein, partial [Polyangiaceae bacterium]|nr:kelch repeat-containing protein [Polyangiaceae bacterium]
RVLVAGGSSSSGARSALASSELYDESTGQFSLTVSLHVARWSQTATLLPDGRVLIVGGDDGTNFLSSVEIYTPDTP